MCGAVTSGLFDSCLCRNRWVCGSTLLTIAGWFSQLVRFVVSLARDASCYRRPKPDRFILIGPRSPICVSFHLSGRHLCSNPMRLGAVGCQDFTFGRTAPVRHAAVCRQTASCSVVSCAALVSKEPSATELWMHHRSANRLRTGIATTVICHSPPSVQFTSLRRAWSC